MFVKDAGINGIPEKIECLFVVVNASRRIGILNITIKRRRKMDLRNCKFKIIGLSPLLCHNPASMVIDTAVKVKAKKIYDSKEEAEAGTYKDTAGRYVFPTMAFRSSLLEGLKGKKINKMSAPNFVSACVSINDQQEFVTLCDPATFEPLTSYTVDVRRVVIQRAGVMRSRPRFEKWACILSLQLDVDSLTPKLIEESLNNAGAMIGVGDFRPSKKGMFGKFKAELIVD